MMLSILSHPLHQPRFVFPVHVIKGEEYSNLYKPKYKILTHFDNFIEQSNKILIWLYKLSIYSQYIWYIGA